MCDLRNVVFYKFSVVIVKRLVRVIALVIILAFADVFSQDLEVFYISLGDVTSEIWPVFFTLFIDLRVIYVVVN